MTLKNALIFTAALILAACMPRPVHTSSFHKSETRGDASKSENTNDLEPDAGEEGSMEEDPSAEKGDEMDSSKTMDTASKEIEKPVEPIKPAVDPKTFAASLDNFRWEFKCDRDVGAEETCDGPIATDVTKDFGGDTSKIYTVDLRFRGVVEPMMYKDGSLEGKRFYIGGRPNNSTYNIYSIEVSEPKQIYFLNSNPNTGHDVFLIDYNAKIKVKGGAKVHLLGNGQNLRMIANFKKLVVPGIDKEGKPFNGQYVQMNVVGVEE
jgi:hypothetical protein